MSISVKLQYTFIVADKICDYIPYSGINTISNLVDIVAKLILKVIHRTFSDFYTRHLSNNIYVQHLNEKHFLFCLVLAIPYVSIPIALYRDIRYISSLSMFSRNAQLQRQPTQPDNLQRMIDEYHRQDREFFEQQERAHGILPENPPPPIQNLERRAQESIAEANRDLERVQARSAKNKEQQLLELDVKYAENMGEALQNVQKAKNNSELSLAQRQIEVYKKYYNLQKEAIEALP